MKKAKIFDTKNVGQALSCKMDDEVSKKWGTVLLTSVINDERSFQLTVSTQK